MTIPSIQVVQVLANAGLDWLIIDMEHGPIDLAAAHAMIVATAGTAIVRWFLGSIGRCYIAGCQACSMRSDEH